MLPDPITITFDHAQSRVQTHPIAAQAWGMGWNSLQYSNVWIDPITHSLMVRPMCLYSAFFTTDSGIYAKPPKTSYEFLTSADWSEIEQYVGAGVYLRTDASGEYARTATAPGKNRGVYLSFFGYGAGTESGVVASCGWDNTVVTPTGSEIGIEFGGDGSVTIYKDGDYVGSGRISYKPNDWNHIILLPMRRRELMVWSIDGVGFSHVFDDIAEGAATPEITPNEKFWFAPNASATSALVQICPLKFESSGYANSEVIAFTRTPDTGQTLRTWTNPLFSGITSANVYGDKSYSGTDDVSAVALRLTDDSGAFVPDSVENQCRIRATLSSDGSYTSFVYGAYLDYPGTTDDCDDSEESEPTDGLIGLTLDVPDDPWGVRLVGIFREPDALAVTVPKLREVSNRPVKLEVGTLTLLDGRTLPTEFTDAVQDEAKQAIVPCRDLTGALDAFTFRDTFVFDGYELSRPTGSGYSAIQHILGSAGLTTSQMDLGDANFIISEVPGQQAEEYSFAVEVGETASRAIERLHQEFAASWFMGTRITATGPVFSFCAESDLPASPVMTIYLSTADAVAGGDDPLQVMLTYIDQPEDVDANEVWATGFDHRKGQIVQAVVVDAASQDCTTAPSSRPDNWLGEPKMFGVIDPRLRTEDDCEQTIDLLAPVVTARRLMGEFDAPAMLWYNSDPGGTDVMLPLWRGDLVTLDGLGDYRITSLSVDFVRNDANVLVTKARYTFGGFTNAGGTSLATIQARNSERRTNSRLLLEEMFPGIGTRFIVSRRRGP